VQFDTDTTALFKLVFELGLCYVCYVIYLAFVVYIVQLLCTFVVLYNVKLSCGVYITYMQGSADDFLAKGQLLPRNFVTACAEAKVPVVLRIQDVCLLVYCSADFIPLLLLMLLLSYVVPFYNACSEGSAGLRRWRPWCTQKNEAPKIQL